MSHAGAGLVIFQRQVYLSAEEVDSPVHNVFIYALPCGKICGTSYKLVPAK